MASLPRNFMRPISFCLKGQDFSLLSRRILSFFSRDCEDLCFTSVPSSSPHKRIEKNSAFPLPSQRGKKDSTLFFFRSSNFFLALPLFFPTSPPRYFSLCHCPLFFFAAYAGSVPRLPLFFFFFRFLSSPFAKKCPSFFTGFLLFREVVIAAIPVYFFLFWGRCGRSFLFFFRMAIGEESFPSSQGGRTVIRHPPTRVNFFFFSPAHLMNCKNFVPTFPFSITATSLSSCFLSVNDSILFFFLMSDFSCFLIPPFFSLLLL